MSETGGEKKKIIIDEDWKSQVEAEKQAAEGARGESEDSDPADTGDSSSPDPSMPLPPADFTTIVSMLATQAMMNLGTLPNPITGNSSLSLPQAKHAIDLIEVLQQKTKGNCNPQEELKLQNLLHELRLAYVAMQNAPETDDENQEEAEA